MAKKIEYIISAKDKTKAAFKSVESGFKGINKSANISAAGIGKVAGALGFLATAFLTAKTAAVNFSNQVKALAEQGVIVKDKDIEAVIAVGENYDRLGNTLKGKVATWWGKVLRLAESGYSTQIKYAGAIKQGRDALLNLDNPFKAYRDHLEAAKKGEDELAKSVKRRAEEQAEAEANKAAKKRIDEELDGVQGDIDKLAEDRARNIEESERKLADARIVAIEDKWKRAKAEEFRRMNEAMANFKGTEEQRRKFHELQSEITRQRLTEIVKSEQEEIANEKRKAQQKEEDLQKAIQAKKDEAQREADEKAAEAAEKRQDYMSGINEQLAQIRIDMIKDDTKREIEQIKKNAKDKLAMIKGTSDREVELRKRIIAQARAEIRAVQEGAQGEDDEGEPWESKIKRSKSGFRGRSKSAFGKAAQVGTGRGFKNARISGGFKERAENAKKKKGKSDVEWLDTIAENTAYLKDNLTAS